MAWGLNVADSLFRMNQEKGNRGALYELLQPAIFPFLGGAGRCWRISKKGNPRGASTLTRHSVMYGLPNFTESWLPREPLKMWAAVLGMLTAMVFPVRAVSVIPVADNRKSASWRGAIDFPKRFSSSGSLGRVALMKGSWARVKVGVWSIG